MCGIAGFYGFNNKDLIDSMSDMLFHRGPDGKGYYIDNNISFINRRLAIIDVKHGNQPIYNEDKSIVIVFNGEIYNFRELRKELEKKGHIFLTNSDTEVIVHGYEEWQDKSFDKLNGMFSIALYNKNKKRLILARDHFGIKPLYYSFLNNNNLIFSSEIKPILNSGLINKAPNDKIIYRYLKYRVHDDNKETFFKGIYKLLPGQMLIIENNKQTFKNYSSLKDDLLKDKTNLRLSPKRIKEFKDKLIKAVQYRLISEAPVGTCLSGGIDSSSVVLISNMLLKEKDKEAMSLGRKQKTFSAVFPGSINDEEKYINEVLRKAKDIKSIKIYPKPEEFFSEIEDFIKTQEEPTISTGPYAQYKVMQEASKYVKVLLDGQGADEEMAGYLPYYFVYINQLFKQKQYLTLIKEVVLSLDVFWPFFINKFKLIFKIKNKLNPVSFLNEEYIKKYKDEKFSPNNNNLKKRLIEDIFENSLQSLLRYEDRNSMRFSIEGRVPFLDFNLLKYIFSLSDKAIINNGWNKYILRKATENILPKTITKRRNKIGFTTPEDEWFLRMKNRIYTIFASKSFASRKYFNQNKVLNAFQKYIEGKNDDTMVFWRMLNLELWLRIFFDSKDIREKDRIKKVEKYNANPDKNINIKVNKKTYLRYPIRTKLFKKGDNYSKIITEYVKKSITELKIKHKIKNKKWFICVSEKIIAISQGRSYFIWDIKTGFWANFLSKHVKKTPYGIGLGSPWTMQLAIQEVGITKILFASILSLITKPFGIKGVFYNITGRKAASIDGPTEYSVYPSNVSAKLAPKEPQKQAVKIHKMIKKEKSVNNGFLGVVIMDANDLGQDVLGNSTNIENKRVERIFSDNPMGQTNEQTPLVIVY